MSLVLLDSRPDGVRVLTLNDPDKRNAMSPGAADRTGRRRRRGRARRGRPRAGRHRNGAAFSAGADLPALFGAAKDQSTSEVRAGLRAVYDSFLRVRDLEIPTIAAVNGAAVGAGVNLAMACDVRIAGPKARFGVTFTKLGLHPGGGCTFFVTQALGRQRALALILDGELLDADEALRLGLVLEVADDPLAARWRGRRGGLRSTRHSRATSSVRWASPSAATSPRRSISSRGRRRPPRRARCWPRRSRGSPGESPAAKGKAGPGRDLTRIVAIGNVSGR